MAVLTTLGDTVHAAVSQDGIIYYARAGYRPVGAGKDFATLAAVLAGCGDRTTLRVLGTAANSALICSAAAWQAEGRISLEVGGPEMGGGFRERQDPHRALAKSSATGIEVPAAAGGWHRFTPDEACFYRAAAARHRGSAPVDVAAMVDHHPIYRRVSFIEPRVDGYLGCLLADIRDPRWYVDRAYPERVGKLYSYFGVDKDARARPDDRGEVTRRLNAEGAWQVFADMPAAARTPRGFLSRICYTSDRGGGVPNRSTTRCLLRFVREIWMDWLYGGGRGREIFVPEYFFQRALGPKGPHAEAAAAYRDHLAAIESGSA